MISKENYICYLILFSVFLWGQEELQDVKAFPDSYYYKKVDQKPVFPSCESLEYHDLIECNSKAVQTELVRHLSYPEKAIEDNRTGIAYIDFIVSEKGDIQKPRIIRTSKHKDLDSAAIAAVSLLFYDRPIIPGKLINGKPVSVSYRIPVRFRIEEELNEVIELTSEEILDRLENMQSPDFDNTRIKLFSDQYIKFVKGIVMGFYLKDRRVIDDWEEFFQQNDLSRIPDQSELTVQDKAKLEDLLEKINYIKYSIH